MENDFKLSNLPKFDMAISKSYDMARQININMKTITQASEEAYRRNEEARLATLETAENTAKMKSDLKTVIHNQNDYIAMLKEQNEYIKQVLTNMFGSSEDSVFVQKEILKIMQESKPTDGMLADKGFDVVIQLVFNAMQIYLKSKGIFF
jgi:hypothetical protein